MAPMAEAPQVEAQPRALNPVQALDPKKREDLVKLAQSRMDKAVRWIRPWHEKWVRFYKIYRAIKDAVDDDDEPNIFLPYCYGIIEDVVSKMVEPLLKLKPPCRVQARKAGHEQAAKNFATAVRNYFSTSEYQLDYTNSAREEAITGNAWEIDEWADEWDDGARWEMQEKTGVLGSIKSLLGKVIDMGESSYPYQARVEVPNPQPRKVGYRTRFPSVFDIFPEPGKKKVKDCKWIAEQERYVTLADLQTQKYTDPATGEKVPVFDLTELLADAGTHEPGQIKPQNTYQGTGYGEEAQQAIAGHSNSEVQEQEQEQGDEDAVYIVTFRERDRIWSVANGKYLIRYWERPFHAPRINMRLRVYTQDTQFLFGSGCIEPAEDLFYEFNDIHNLSMQNWIRIIHRMLAVKMDAIPFPDDFKPRAQGKIRVKTSTNIHDVMMPIEHADVGPSMLLMESNSKGLIERALAVPDFSPGTEGTKQTHKTATGLMEIRQELANRYVTIRRSHLAYYQDQMWFMEKLFTQFQFDKVPYLAYGPDGSTSMVELNMDDYDTGGVGFEFLIEEDPAFGDDALRREQRMVLLRVLMEYEQWRVTIGGPDNPQAKVGEVLKSALNDFGYSDTSRILVQPAGQMDPATELDLMLQGQEVEPAMDENLTGHLLEHFKQAMSPKVQQAMQAGKVDPGFAARLDVHIRKTIALIQGIMTDPTAIVRAQMQEEMVNQPRGKQPMPGAERPGTMGNA